MKEYQKIPSVYKFDSASKKYVEEFFSPYFEYLKDNEWIVSEKVDGTNIRVYYDGHRVSWSGRTDKSELPKEVESLLQATFGESEIIFEQTFGEKEVELFMECYGGKIQGGLYGGQERLIGFDIMVNGVYLDKLCIKGIFDKFGVRTVDFVVVSCLDSVITLVKRLAYFQSLDYIDTDIAYVYSGVGCSSLSIDRPTDIEGYVCVPKLRILDAQGNRVIVKIKTETMRKLK